MSQAGLAGEWDVPGIRIREWTASTYSVTPVPTAVPAFVCLHEHKTTPHGITGVAGLGGYASVVRHVLAGYFANGGGPCWLVPVPEHSPEAYAQSLPLLKDGNAGVTIIAAPDLQEGAGRAEAQKWLAAHCTGQEWIALLDYPVDDTVLGSHCQYAAVYAPSIVMPSLDGPEQPPVTVPPCGHVAGVMARTDGGRGVHVAPANVPVNAVQALEPDVASDAAQRRLGPHVNCLRWFPDRQTLVWGARTLSTDRYFRHLNVRRLVSHLKIVLRESTGWVIDRPNDDATRDGLGAQVRRFLTEQWLAGALAGDTADDAFRVNCTSTGTKISCAVKVAPLTPAEFVTFSFTQSARV
ncbi:phage tail sheath family protein [Streptomyces sp. NPDC001339]|uniref:phage tail sheath family protein n=1 Tax=Streptomyces sp. NPDC001339 TaxID=3364563 RepID=UPI0036C9F916